MSDWRANEFRWCSVLRRFVAAQRFRTGLLKAA
jgi:hypothetical protein